MTHLVLCMAFSAQRVENWPSTYRINGAWRMLSDGLYLTGTKGEARASTLVPWDTLRTAVDPELVLVAAENRVRQDLMQTHTHKTREEDQAT